MKGKLKNRIKIVKGFGAGVFAAGLIYYAAAMSLMVDATFDVDSLNGVLDDKISALTQTSEYQDHVERNEDYFYSEYKKGNISATEFATKVSKLANREYICENSNKFTSNEKAEEIKKIKEDVDRKKALVTAYGVSGVGALGTGIGSVIIAKKQIDAMIRNEEEREI